MNLSRGRVLWASWYAGAILASIAGTRMAYSNRFSSEAWQCWSSPTAWKRDVARVIVSATLSIFLLWSMNAFSTSREHQEKQLSFFPLRRYEWMLLVGSVIFLMLFNLVLLPNSFRAGLDRDMATLVQKHGCEGLQAKIANDDYRLIMKPYIPYFLYIFGMWFGIVLPLFLVLLRSVSVDWKQWRERRLRLGECVSSEFVPSVQKPFQAFEKLLTAFQDYIVGLKDISERYVPVLLAVSLALLYEQVTPSFQTVTPAAEESGKLALWLLLGPAFLICITIVALGYQSAAHKAESGLRVLIKSSDSGKDADAFKAISEARSKLIWDQSPATFIFSVVKSATVSIPLLLAIIVYVLHSRSDGWYIFVPKALVNFVQNMYK